MSVTPLPAEPTENTIEIEGETKPALIAESLSMLMTAPPATPGARP